MIEKWTTPIPKLSGREGRTVYVYVPDEAQENPEARYPVLYMFDGHNVFFDSDATYGKCWGMKEYLESTNTPLVFVVQPAANALVAEITASAPAAIRSFLSFSFIISYPSGPGSTGPNACGCTGSGRRRPLSDRM